MKNKFISLLFFICFSFNNLFSKSEILAYHEFYRLDNGMKIILIPDFNNPIIDIKLSIEAGSLDDPSKKEGLAEDAFYSLLDGTNKFSEAEIINSLISFGNHRREFKSFWMSYEFSFIENICLKEDTEKCLELFSDIVKNPSFKNKNSYIGTFISRLLNGIFDSHNYGVSDHLSYRFCNFKSGDYKEYYKHSLKKWYKEFIHPKNITLSISGDFNSIHIKNIINKYFADWNPNIPPTDENKYTINITDSSGININFLEEKGFKNASIYIWKKTHDIEVFNFAADMASNIFSRQKIPLIKNSIYHSRNIDYNKDNNTEMPHLEIQIKELNYSLVNTYYENLINSFNEFSNNSITENDLKEEKSYQVDWYTLTPEIYDIEQMNNHFFYIFTQNGDIPSIDKLKSNISQIQSVSLTEINEAAKKVFDPDNFIMVIQGNKDSCQTFLDQFDNVNYYKNGDEPK